jgi:biopolymer transport protein ExbD
VRGFHFWLLVFFGMTGAQGQIVWIVDSPPINHLERIVPVQITIDEKGSVFVNSTEVAGPQDAALNSLILLLKAIMGANVNQPVVVEPDPRTQHQRVMAVLTACLNVKVKNLALGKWPYQGIPLPQTTFHQSY